MISLAKGLGRIGAQVRDSGWRCELVPYHAGVVAKYKDVDWALDISEAIFSDADFYYVPGELIRRDENTQVLLRREDFRDINWRELPGYVGLWVRRFESAPSGSIVGIAPKDSKDFGKAMAGIELWVPKTHATWADALRARVGFIPCPAAGRLGTGGMIFGLWA
jgi:hypothetical protein